MSDTKLKLKDLGTIHLMALDTTSLLLPFGRPISDYLKGEAGNQNGSRAFLNRSAIDFAPSVRWDESIAALLQTTGFGELEREGIVESEPAPVEAPDPGMAGFLQLEEPGLVALDPTPVKTSTAYSHLELPVSLPRILALPLRQRMTFGSAPQKAKPAPAAVPKAAAPAPAAKPAVVSPAPPKPAAAQPAKPAVVAPQKAVPSAPVQAKPAAQIPPAPKPGPTAAPAIRANVAQPPAPPAAKTAVAPKPNVPAAPAARAPEPSPAPGKPATPARVAVPPAARANENVTASRDSAAKASAPVTSSRPLAPPFAPERGSSTGVMEQASAHEVIARQTSKPTAPEVAPRTKGPLSITETPKPVESPARSSFEPNLGGADSASMFERIPMMVKLGVVLSVVAGGLYFGLSKSSEKPAANKPVAVGEQGWSTEWASDAVGSRRARQLTMYRPSAGLSDYHFQFAGQIESKALGWIFRASDTKNYYAMKIESYRPGTMSLTHFAVVDGRESSYSQKPLTVSARPGSVYNVKLEVTGPRFTVSIQGEPVDFWTDNRLKVGSVGLMNERDERGVASAVQFSFPKAGN